MDLQAVLGGERGELQLRVLVRGRHSVGFALPAHTAELLERIPAAVWAPAYDADGAIRAGAWVAELTGLLDLSGWPAGMRVIVRKERAHLLGRRWGDRRTDRSRCHARRLWRLFQADCAAQLKEATAADLREPPFVQGGQQVEGVPARPPPLPGKAQVTDGGFKTIKRAIADRRTDRLQDFARRPDAVGHVAGQQPMLTLQQ